MLANNTPLSAREAAMYSPLVLAYLGDCVYELFVRERLVLRANMSNGKLHMQAKEYVSATGQSAAARKLLPLLQQDELAIFRRGRNSGAVPNRNNDVGEYHAATGLEALFGYLYLTGNTDRLAFFMDLVFDSRPETEKRGPEDEKIFD